MRPSLWRPEMATKHGAKTGLRIDATSARPPANPTNQRLPTPLISPNTIIKTQALGGCRHASFKSVDFCHSRLIDLSYRRYGKPNEIDHRPIISIFHAEHLHVFRNISPKGSGSRGGYRLCHNGQNGFTRKIYPTKILSEVYSVKSIPVECQNGGCDRNSSLFVRIMGS